MNNLKCVSTLMFLSKIDERKYLGDRCEETGISNFFK